MRHERSASHQRCLKNAGGTPTINDFKKVKDCVLRHGSIGPGLDGVGDRKKSGKWCYVCLKLSTRLKQIFFKTALSTIRSRDARATKLVARFNAIDSDFKTMRRVVGVQPNLLGSMDIL